MDELITVFMPVYNAEKYLKESIDSIINQTYKNFELLIINDGSTDNSMKIVESYKDKRIKVYSNDGNKGLPYTRNRGLELACGNYFAIMDADDIAKPNRLELELKFLKDNPSYDIVGSRFDFLIESKLIKSNKKNFEFENVNMECLYFCPLLNSSAMIKMDFIKKYNIKYRNDYFIAQDYAFWVDCAKYTNIARLSKPLLIYRTGHENITKITCEEKNEERKKLIDEIRKKAWNNFGIEVFNSELNLINTIFSDPKIEMEKKDIIDFINLISKIIKNNDFENKSDLAIITKNALVDKVIEMNISNISKIKLISFIFDKEPIKSIIKSYIKLIYKILLQ